MGGRSKWKIVKLFLFSYHFEKRYYIMIPDKIVGVQRTKQSVGIIVGDLALDII